MTIEKFLHVWSQHNTLIIESLIGLVILLSLFLAYRSFFGKKAEQAEGGVTASNGNIDAGQLEKTLQKILENQSLGAKLAANDDLSVDAPIDSHDAAADGEQAPEVAQLRASLSDSSKKIQILQTQLAQAQEQATQAQAQAAAASSQPAAPAAGAAGVSSEERDELNAKLRDLEARLAEYEIISEDIADLSKYREENDDLKKQLEALKSQGPAAAAAAAPAPAAPVAAAPAPEPEPVVAAAPAAEPAPEPAAEPAAAATEEVLDASILEMMPPKAEPAADLIDDDLMKEFAAAVEGQKALDQAAEKAGDGSEKAATNPDDTDKLMNEFENFVGNKKS